MRYLKLTTLILPLLVALAGVAAFVGVNKDLYLVAIGIGVIEVCVAAYYAIAEGNWSLDYIALLAMVVAMFSHEWLAGAVIALMYTGGEALETYASRRADASLAALLSRIPKTALVKHTGAAPQEIAVPGHSDRR